MVFTLSRTARQQRLLNYLRDNGISLSEVSRLIGRSPSLVSRMINGKRTFLEKYKISICDQLSVTRDILFDE